MDRSAAARSLRAGDSVRLIVSEKTPDGSVVLRGHGIRAVAESRPGWIPGKALTFRVAARGSSLELELVSGGERSPVTSHSPGTSQPQASPAVSPVLDALARALAASGIEPESRLVQHVIQLYQQRYGDSRPKESRATILPRMRALLEAADRGLDPDDALLQCLTGYPPHGDHPGHDTSRDPDDNEDTSESISLETYLNRAVKKPDHLLQLHNALAPSGDVHWIVVPVSATARGVHCGDGSGTAVDAVLKVCYHKERKVPVEAVLSARRPDGDNLWFRWVFRGTENRRGMTVELIDAVVGEDLHGNNVFYHLLARLGYTGHTGHTNTVLETDGYSLNACRGVKLPGFDVYG